MTRPSTIFYSLSAQPDNIGDIEIRKEVLSWIRESGREIVLFVGPMPQGYLEGFGDLTDCELHTRSLTFEIRLLREALRGNATIVLAPGPQVFGPSNLAVRSAINLLNVLVAKFRGGAGLAVGRSLRGQHSIGRSLDRFLIKQFALFTVRDAVSSDAIGLELPSYPDLAFASSDTLPTTAGRHLLALSFRSDREVPLPALSRLVEAARAIGLEPVFVSQVKRDDARHSELGDAVAVRTELWGTRSHVEQEEAAREIYRNSAYVVSNRLHGLILGMQCGALPVTYAEAGFDKVASTLHGVVMSASWPVEDASGTPGAPWLSADRGPQSVRLETELAAAGARLDQLRGEFLARLS
jgi:hypothetical protein